jgi:hypothetical protein|tara:strand:+ start:49 stop:783 length:735 start_codon:yes stop_codon:yes gene_type:complete
MTKTIILWSGGADSTVIVDQMLRNTTDELVLCHILFTNSVEDNADGHLWRKKHKAIAAAQVAAITQIADYWEQSGYRPFALDIMPYQLPIMYQYGSHGIMFPFMGALAVRNHDADRFITGITPVTLRDENAKKKHEDGEDLFNLLVKYPIATTRVRSDMSLPGEKVTGVLGENSYSHVKWEKPLVELGWGKRGVVKQLPPKLRRLVVSCDYPTTHEDHWERCGKCFRCNKWEQVGGLVDGDDDV